MFNFFPWEDMPKRATFGTGSSEAIQQGLQCGMDKPAQDCRYLNCVVKPFLLELHCS